jgi:hypothetical protein
MVGNRDYARLYLHTYLLQLIDLCKDANASFSIIEKSVDELRRPMPNVWDDPDCGTKMNSFHDEKKKAWTMLRISGFAFAGFSAIISNIIWPYTDGKKNKNNMKQKRKHDLEKFFPQNQYPALSDKDYRDFLVHFDERLDTFENNSSHHNLVTNVMGENAVSGNVTIMDGFDPYTFVVTFYNRSGGIGKANLRAISQELDKILHEIPNALTEIHDYPSGWADNFIKC